MKIRNLFVSNSSSSSYVVLMDKNHDQSKWHKTSELKIMKDTHKVLMKFDDFSDHSDVYDTVSDMWKFLCSQMLYWTCSCICGFEYANKTKKQIVRMITQSDEFERVNNALKEFIPGCEGIEFDEEDLYHPDNEDEDHSSSIALRQDCSIDHESIYDGLDDMMKHFGATSIPELIFGVKTLKIAWG